MLAPLPVAEAVVVPARSAVGRGCQGCWARGYCAGYAPVGLPAACPLESRSASRSGVSPSAADLTP